jgi:uncharacterized protein YgiM (DUF1202 family)
MKAARITTILVALALSVLAGSARAQEQAFTNRATELRERADASAKLLANLPNNTAVKVISRSGGWTQVEAAGAKGWVRVFHLRFPATVAESSSGSTLGGLTAALGFGKPKQEATKISTVGVRGLSEDEIKNANPDANALKKMQSLRVEKPEAERFAREAKLAAQNVAYPSGGS